MFKNSFDAGSEGLSMCRLKSPVKIIILYFECMFVKNSENSLIKAALSLGGL